MGWCRRTCYVNLSDTLRGIPHAWTDDWNAEGKFRFSVVRCEGKSASEFLEREFMNSIPLLYPIQVGISAVIIVDVNTSSCPQARCIREMFVPFSCKVVLVFAQISVASDKQRGLSRHPPLRNKSGWFPTHIRSRPNGGRTILQTTSEIPTHVSSHFTRTFIPTHFTKYYVDITTTLNRAVMHTTYIREISAPNLDWETKYPDWSPTWFSTVPQGKCKDRLPTSNSAFVVLCQIFSDAIHSFIQRMVLLCEILKGAFNKVYIKHKR